MTTPVEELRSAAVLLRQRAEDATPGPWQHTGSGIGQDHMGCGEVFTLGDGVEGGAVAAPAGDCYPRGGYSPAGDMAYIATMDPLVGLALAELLEHIGDDLSDDGGHEVTAAPKSWVVDNYGSLRSDWTAALALARLILGGDS